MSWKRNRRKYLRNQILKNKFWDMLESVRNGKPFNSYCELQSYLVDLGNISKYLLEKKIPIN